jgi:hypothetical protein
MMAAPPRTSCPAGRAGSADEPAPDIELARGISSRKVRGGDGTYREEVVHGGKAAGAARREKPAGGDGGSEELWPLRRRRKMLKAERAWGLVKMEVGRHRC